MAPGNTRHGGCLMAMHSEIRYTIHRVRKRAGVLGLRKGRSMHQLSPDEETLLQGYRERLRAESYEPLTDEELVSAKERRLNAQASAAIEGLHGTPMQEALFDLFEELRVPGDLCESILDDYTDDQLLRLPRPDAAE